MVLNAQLLVIDPLRSFMDDGSLPVPGAHEDARRLGRHVDDKGDKYRVITVMTDAHHIIDVGHPEFWRDQDGNIPQLSPTNPAMPIFNEQIKSRIWVPQYENAKPSALRVGKRDRTIGEYVDYYSYTLEEQGEYPLFVYNEHCLIGSDGASVESKLFEAFSRWERRKYRNVNYVTKGSNPWTEHYGALQANVPLPSDPTTGLNMDILNMLRTADIIGVAGWALSHCYRATVNQIAQNIGEQHLSKIHLLRDCTSPIPAVPGGGPSLDFPALSEVWLKEMEARGMTVTTSDGFLA
jgi:nicotinamidase/pyrazinamidase